LVNACQATAIEYTCTLILYTSDTLALDKADRAELDIGNRILLERLDTFHYLDDVNQSINKKLIEL